MDLSVWAPARPILAPVRTAPVRMPVCARNARRVWRTWFVCNMGSLSVGNVEDASSGRRVALYMPRLPSVNEATDADTLGARDHEPPGRAVRRGRSQRHHVDA